MVLKPIDISKGENFNISFIEKCNNTKNVLESDEIITDEELRLHFPPANDNKGFGYSGRCSYCDVEINFSNTAEIKIKAEGGKGTQKILLYHNGCYERYLRRTID